MREKHKARARIGVFGGLIISILGIFIYFGLSSVQNANGPSSTSETDVTMFASILAVGYLLLLWGCIEQALAKGYSVLMGLIGLVGILGLVILAVLPEIPENKVKSNRTGVAR